MRFPPSIHFSLSHNRHKVYYESVAEYLARDADLYETSPEDEAAMVATDEIWELQWYPRTPIGFNLVVAPTLERVLELANVED